MELGAWVLVCGCLAVGAVHAAPLQWRRAAGGALILLTVILLTLQLLGAL